MPPRQRVKGGGKGISGLDEAALAQPQMPQQPSAGGQMVPANAAPPTWTATGPWMQPANPIQVVDSMQAGSVPTGWRIKVIQSFDKKQNYFQPAYAPDDEAIPAAEEESEQCIQMKPGVVRKTNNGRKSLRPNSFISSTYTIRSCPFSL